MWRYTEYDRSMCYTRNSWFQTKNRNDWIANSEYDWTACYPPLPCIYTSQTIQRMRSEKENEKQQKKKKKNKYTECEKYKATKCKSNTLKAMKKQLTQNSKWIKLSYSWYYQWICVKRIALRHKLAFDHIFRIT